MNDLGLTHASLQALSRLSKQVKQLQRELHETNQRNTALLNELRSIRTSVVDTLLQAIEARDIGCRNHSQRVVNYFMTTHKVLNQQSPLQDQDLEALRYGVLLHDVGKLGVPDSILSKPGPLTDDEWSHVRRHPEFGHRLLQCLPIPDDALPVVLYHHERYDGSGYPYGAKGDEIPQAARISAVVDAFDAMTSDRPYRKARPPESAIEEILRCKGSHFDPEVADAFVSAWRGDIPKATFSTRTQR